MDACTGDCATAVYFDRLGAAYDGYRPPDPQLTATEIDLVLAATDHRPGHAADLMCGPGRHTLELAARGWTVTGVDRIEPSLATLRDRARAAGVDGRVHTVHGDVAATELPAAAYRLVLLLGNSFGFAADRPASLALLRRAAASLAPGGAVALEVFDRDRAPRPARKEHRLPGGGLTKTISWDAATETEHVYAVITLAEAEVRTCYRQFLPGAASVADLARAAGLTALRLPIWPSADAALYLLRAPAGAR
ncbi:hypothetical protein Cs7R123_48680 [Catellatospora sp. TT07R-123]|uniref:class I SAM-dependent methyltransferase n=1 Tax=Catellatospora sp. TT07R-123 TaxID=2733863 RepID=UPI001B0B72CA|nr:class I SAM-dependent methyltransferase [Catellatospora sp. TT07R-123]GHJ47526.1 hypothetical protein Cs7R123_48680 [Catellatospora sp. TT07R-123]